MLTCTEVSTAPFLPVLLIVNPLLPTWESDLYGADEPDFGNDAEGSTDAATAAVIEEKPKELSSPAAPKSSATSTPAPAPTATAAPVKRPLTPPAPVSKIQTFTSSSAPPRVVPGTSSIPVFTEDGGAQGGGPVGGTRANSQAYGGSGGGPYSPSMGGAAGGQFSGPPGDRSVRPSEMRDEG